MFTNENSGHRCLIKKHTKPSAKAKQLCVVELIEPYKKIDILIRKRNRLPLIHHLKYKAQCCFENRKISEIELKH